MFVHIKFGNCVFLDYKNISAMTTKVQKDIMTKFLFIYLLYLKKTHTGKIVFFSIYIVS